jgi:hypothetical protein
VQTGILFLTPDILLAAAMRGLIEGWGMCDSRVKY